jgi:hypothetical protein
MIRWLRALCAAVLLFVEGASGE